MMPGSLESRAFFVKKNKRLGGQVSKFRKGAASGPGYPGKTRGHLMGSRVPEHRAEGLGADQDPGTPCQGKSLSHARGSGTIEADWGKAAADTPTRRDLGFAQITWADP